MNTNKRPVKMLFYSLILLFLLPLSALAFNEKPEWFRCQSVQDCTLEPGICGAPEAINRKFEKPYRVWVQETAPAVDCESHASSWPGSICVKCEQSRCKVSIPSSPSTSKKAR